MRKEAPPNSVIRSEFPTVSWYEPKLHYRIDARAKGGPQHYRAHREEAIALANQMAADYESNGRAAFSDPSLHEELLKALGTNPQKIIAHWLRTHSETNGSKPTGEAFDEFAEFKQRSMRTEISRHSVIKPTRRFINFVGRETPLSAITLKLVEQYLSQLKSAGNLNT